MLANRVGKVHPELLSFVNHCSLVNVYYHSTLHHDALLDIAYPTEMKTSSVLGPLDNKFSVPEPRRGTKKSHLPDQTLSKHENRRELPRGCTEFS